jgi:hypothetical protein
LDAQGAVTGSLCLGRGEQRCASPRRIWIGLRRAAAGADKQDSGERGASHRTTLCYKITLCRALISDLASAPRLKRRFNQALRQAAQTPTTSTLASRALKPNRSADCSNAPANVASCSSVAAPQRPQMRNCAS